MLFADTLKHEISSYVFGLLPAGERSTGLAVEVFTVRSQLVVGVLGGGLESVCDVDRYWIVTLTDRFLRLHQLDYWWELSQEGYDYIEKSRRDGRFRPTLNFDTVMDVYGKRLCYLPNEIARIEIPCHVGMALEVKTVPASQRIQFHVRDNHMVNVDTYLSIRLLTGAAEVSFNSFYLGIQNLLEKLNA
jgi:hypothetical protein